jgi:phage terminase small subunit
MGMPKLTARKEQFCQRFVECANAAGAARSAGYSQRSARNTAYRLMRDPRVVERIAELHAETARAHCNGLEILLSKLEAVYRRAFEDHQYAVATRAIELQAKLAGFAPGRPSAGKGGAVDPPPTPCNDNDARPGHPADGAPLASDPD